MLEKFIISILPSAIIVFRNVTHIIFYPYKTMRKISKNSDYMEVFIIFTIVYGYYIFANIVRERTIDPLIISSSSLISFLIFAFTFIIVSLFFYVISKRLNPQTQLKSIISLFAYSLAPTCIWFFLTSLLFYLIPPPRTTAILGQVFSFVFIVFSITLLLWRIILLYLSLRFSMKVQFYSLVGVIIMFGLWFIPYSYLMYQFKIFRIPFI